MTRPPAAASLAATTLITGVLALAITQGLGAVVLALAVAVPTLLALTVRPQLGILLLAALVPFSGLLVLVDAPGIVAGWKEALILMTLAATFVSPASSRRQEPPARPGWVAGAVFLFALTVLAAVPVADGRALSGLKIGFFYLLVPVILWRCPLAARERDRLVSVLMVTGFLTALYGLAQQAMGAVRLNQLGYEYNTEIRFSGDFLRSFSTFIQPFPFALFLMVVLLVGIPHALEQPERLRSRFLWVAAPVMVAALAVTFVRAAWLGLAIGLLVLGLRRYRLLLLPLPIALLGLLFLPASVSSSAFSASSSGQRLSTWQENLDQIVEHPFGLGAGASGSAAVGAAEQGVEGPLLLLPDNHYFKILYDTGILGLWLFVLLLVAIYAAANRAALAAEGADLPLAWGFVGVVVAVCAASLMANVFEIFPVDLLFWMLTGVVTFGPAAVAPTLRAPTQPVATAATR